LIKTHPECVKELEDKEKIPKILMKKKWNAQIHILYIWICINLAATFGICLWKII